MYTVDAFMVLYRNEVSLHEGRENREVCEDCDVWTTVSWSGFSEKTSGFRLRSHAPPRWSLFSQRGRLLSQLLFHLNNYWRTPPPFFPVHLPFNPIHASSIQAWWSTLVLTLPPFRPTRGPHLFWQRLSGAPCIFLLRHSWACLLGGPFREFPMFPPRSVP